MVFASLYGLEQRTRCSSATLLGIVGLAFVVSGVAFAGPGELPAQSAITAPDTGRPVIIVVHGRGQLLGDSVAVRAQWSKVLQAGASKLAGTCLLRDEDVWVAWYADALDPLSPAVCNLEPSSGASANGAPGDEGIRLRGGLVL